MRRSWDILLQGASAALLSAILIVLLVGTSYAQAVAPAAATPYPTAPRPLATATPPPPTPAAARPLRTIVVLGQGEVVAAPSLARVEIGVETIDPAIAAAVAANEATIREVLASLREYVAEADMHTTSYNVYPERDYQAGGLAPILGYHVTNMLQVSVRDLSMVAPVLEAATEAGANQIYGVSFDLDPAAHARAESEARARANANLIAHAEELARLYNGRLGELVSVSEVIGSDAFTPYGYGAGGGGSDGPTITPGGLSVVVRLQATFTIDG